MPDVFVVIGREGDYPEERSEWPIASYPTEELAETHCRHAQTAEVALTEARRALLDWDAEHSPDPEAMSLAAFNQAFDRHERELRRRIARLPRNPWDTRIPDQFNGAATFIVWQVPLHQRVTRASKKGR